jgi:hypothetical protein
LKPEWWGSQLVQEEKYWEEKACDRRYNNNNNNNNNNNEIPHFATQNFPGTRNIYPNLSTFWPLTPKKFTNPSLFRAHTTVTGYRKEAVSFVLRGLVMKPEGNIPLE